MAGMFDQVLFDPAIFDPGGSTGAAASRFTWSCSLDVHGPAASTWGWRSIATGHSGNVTGAAASRFAWTPDAAGLVEVDATGIFNVTFRWTPTGTAVGQFGQGASRFGWSTAGTGLGYTVTGTSAPAFTWAPSASAEVTPPPTGAAASAFAWVPVVTGIVFGVTTFGWATSGHGSERNGIAASGPWAWRVSGTGGGHQPPPGQSATDDRLNDIYGFDSRYGSHEWLRRGS